MMTTAVVERLRQTATEAKSADRAEYREAVKAVAHDENADLLRLHQVMDRLGKTVEQFEADVEVERHRETWLAQYLALAEHQADLREFERQGKVIRDECERVAAESKQRANALLTELAPKMAAAQAGFYHGNNARVKLVESLAPVARKQFEAIERQQTALSQRRDEIESGDAAYRAIGGHTEARRMRSGSELARIDGELNRLADQFRTLEESAIRA